MPEIPETDLAVTIAADTSGFDAAIERVIEAPIRGDERRKVAEELREDAAAHRRLAESRARMGRPGPPTPETLLARASTLELAATRITRRGRPR
jgi:hypothetical protein